MSKVNILLVEDNMLNQLVVKNLLKKNGIDVAIANHGGEALDQLQNKTFDMVLMDIQMPVMDGYESTSRIRAMEDPYFQSLPILAFTASLLIDSREKAVKHGMTDYINKPFVYEELQEKINHYVLGSATRPICIDYEEHTGGDLEYKQQLLKLMTDDVDELRQSINMIEGTNASAFLRTYHKVTTTLSILNDRELREEVTSLRNHYKGALVLSSAHVNMQISKAYNLCEMITDALKKEMSKFFFE